MEHSSTNTSLFGSSAFTRALAKHFAPLRLARRLPVTSFFEGPPELAHGPAHGGNRYPDTFRSFSHNSQWRSSVASAFSSS